MEFVLIASAHFLALLSPGPDFFLIMQAALRLPLRYAISICAGIAIANGVYLVLAISSLEMMREMSMILSILKYIGGGYLLYVGIMLLRTPMRLAENKANHSFLHAHRLWQQFIIGFLSAILNPKNIVFYLSLFTVMVSADTPFLTRCAYALWMVSVVFCWDCFVVVTIGRDGIKKRLGTGIFYIEKIAGTALACFGILLPLL